MFDTCINGSLSWQIPVSMDSHVAWYLCRWVPYVFTIQSMDPLHYVQIIQWILYATYKSNQLIPSAYYKSIGPINNTHTHTHTHTHTVSHTPITRIIICFAWIWQHSIEMQGTRDNIETEQRSISPNKQGNVEITCIQNKGWVGLGEQYLFVT